MAAHRYKALSEEVASEESESCVVTTATSAPQDAMVEKARCYLRTIIILSSIGLGLSCLMIVLTGVAFAVTAPDLYYNYRTGRHELRSESLDGGFANTAGFWMTIPQLVLFALSLAVAIRSRKQLPHFADVQRHDCCSQPGMICMVIFNSLMLLFAMMGAIALMVGTLFFSGTWLGLYAGIALCAMAVFCLDITILVFHIVLLCRQRWTVRPRGGRKRVLAKPSAGSEQTVSSADERELKSLAQ